MNPTNRFSWSSLFITAVGTLVACSSAPSNGDPDGAGGRAGEFPGGSGGHAGGSGSSVGGTGANFPAGGAGTAAHSGGANPTTPSGGSNTLTGGTSGTGGRNSADSSYAGVAGDVSGPAPKLCSISLSCPKSIKNLDKTPCETEILDGQGVAAYQGNAGLEVRGRSSQEFPKKNYAVELWTATAEENPTNLLGMGKESDWILDGAWADRSFQRNALAFDSFRGFTPGNYAPRNRFCTLVLNGEPQGIYRLGEKIKKDDDRVSLAEDDGKGSSFLIKQDDDGVLQFPLGLGKKWQLVYPKQATATSAQRSGIQSWLDQLQTALSSTSTSTATSGVFAQLDLEKTVDWLLLEEFTKNIDAFNLSVYFARTAGSKAWPIPWDIDLAYGQPTVSGLPKVKDNERPEGWVANRTDFIVSLTRSPALLGRLGPRWQELRRGPLSDKSLLWLLDRYAATLDAAAITENFRIWPIADVDYVSIYEPYTLYPVTSYADEATKLRTWILARLAWVDEHIASYPN